MTKPPLGRKAVPKCVLQFGRASERRCGSARRVHCGTYKSDHRFWLPVAQAILHPRKLSSKVNRVRSCGWQGRGLARSPVGHPWAVSEASPFVPVLGMSVAPQCPSPLTATLTATVTATGADAQRRGGRPWNPPRPQPLAPHTFTDAGGRPWNPGETNPQSAGRRFDPARRLQRFQTLAGPFTCCLSGKLAPCGNTLVPRESVSDSSANTETKAGEPPVSGRPAGFVFRSSPGAEPARRAARSRRRISVLPGSFRSSP